MTYLFKISVPAIAVAAGLALVPVAAEARHDGDRCEGSESAEAKVHGTGPHAMHHAKRAAIAAWKQEVAAEDGWAYARWRNAKDKEIDCDTDDGMTECEVEADPCRW